MARAFRFRLEPVLRLRKGREEAQQRVVAEHVRRSDEARRRAESIAAAIGAQVAEVRAGLGQGRVAVDEVIAGCAWLGRLRRDWLAAQFELVERARRLESERAALMKAVVARKTIERLKERRLAVHRETEDRQETRLLDEIGATGHWRSAAAEDLSV